MVVAGADVAVAAQAVGLLAHDEQQLAVRLEADHSVDDVDAGALELAGPGDVGLLVEAGLDLHDGDDLLAGLGGLDEGVHDRGVAGGAVEGLLDGQDLGVGGGLGHELLDGGGEGVVGVVQQDVVLAHGGEDVRRGGGLVGGQARGRHRHEARVLQVGDVQVVELVEAGQVQGCGELEDVVALEAQGAHQVAAGEGGDGVLHLQAHAVAEAAPLELLLHGLEEVLGVVLLDLEVLVAGDPEEVVLQDVHAREEVVEVLADDDLDGDDGAAGGLVRGVELAAGDLDEARQGVGHLDAGEVLLAAARVAQDDGEVEGQARDVGEGVGRVDRQRGEDRVDLVAEVAGQALLLVGVELVPAQDLHVALGQGRADVLLEEGGLAGGELLGAAGDLGQDLVGVQAGGAHRGDAGLDAAHEPGDAHHVELVQVGGEDRQEPGALQQGQGVVLGLLQDALVEVQPGQLPVDEAVLEGLQGRQEILGVHLGGVGGSG